MRKLFERNPQLEAPLGTLCEQAGIRPADGATAVAALVNQRFLRCEKDRYSRADRPAANVRRRTA